MRENTDQKKTLYLDTFHAVNNYVGETPTHVVTLTINMLVDSITVVWATVNGMIPTNYQFSILTEYVIVPYVGGIFFLTPVCVTIQTISEFSQ